MPGSALHLHAQICTCAYGNTHTLLAVMQFASVENVENMRKMETGILTYMKTCFDKMAFGLIISKWVSGSWEDPRGAWKWHMEPSFPLFETPAEMEESGSKSVCGDIPIRFLIFPAFQNTWSTWCIRKFSDVMLPCSGARFAGIYKGETTKSWV